MEEGGIRGRVVREGVDDVSSLFLFCWSIVVSCRMKMVQFARDGK